jgi:V/A-type H+-transporting ATPase subunit D
MAFDQAPTHAAVLELKAEQTVVGEAYEFLDEKRLLLAAELLQQLNRYEHLLAELEEATRQARQQLGAAVKRHGLQGLTVYPAASMDGAGIETSRRNLMGVTLVETALRVNESAAHPAQLPGNPSGEAQRCRETFRELTHLGAELAGVSRQPVSPVRRVPRNGTPRTRPGEYHSARYRKHAQPDERLPGGN